MNWKNFRHLMLLGGICLLLTGCASFAKGVTEAILEHEDLDHEQRRLRVLRLLQLEGRLVCLVLRREQELAQIAPDVRQEELAAAIDLGAERGLALVDPARHVRVLRPLTREQEHDRPLAVRLAREDSAGRAPRIQRPHQPDRLRPVAADDGTAVLESLAAHLGREGHVGERALVPPLEMLGQPLRGRVQRGRGPRGDQEELPRPRARGGTGGRRFLDDQVGIRAAHAERAHAGAPGPAVRRPRPKLGVDEEGTPLEVELGVGLLEVQARWDRLVSEREHGLDQARRAGGGVQVPQVRLDGADRARCDALRSQAPEGLGQSGDLDRIAEVRRGSMALDVADRVRIDTGHLERLGDGPRLTLDPGCVEADPVPPVVVQGRAADDSVDRVSLRERVLEARQDHDGRTVAADLSGRAGVEGPHVPVRREDPSVDVDVTFLPERADRHTAGQAQVALRGEQALAGEVDGDEGGRAGGLDRDARAAQVEHVGGARRQEVLLVGHRLRDGAHRLQDVRVGAQVLEEVMVLARAGEEPDRAGVAPGVAAGVLQRLPGALEEDALLGIRQLGLARVEAEEGGVEQVGVLDSGTRLDVVRVGDQGRIDAGRGQLLVGEEGHGFDAVPQIPPELVDVAGARKASRRADDRDRPQGTIILSGNLVANCFP